MMKKTRELSGSRKEEGEEKRSGEDFVWPRGVTYPLPLSAANSKDQRHEVLRGERQGGGIATEVKH